MGLPPVLVGHIQPLLGHDATKALTLTAEALREERTMRRMRGQPADQHLLSSHQEKTARYMRDSARAAGLWQQGSTLLKNEPLETSFERRLVEPLLEAAEREQKHLLSVVGKLLVPNEDPQVHPRALFELLSRPAAEVRKMLPFEPKVGEWVSEITQRSTMASPLGATKMLRQGLSNGWFAGRWVAKLALEAFARLGLTLPLDDPRRVQAAAWLAHMFQIAGPAAVREVGLEKSTSPHDIWSLPEPRRTWLAKYEKRPPPEAFLAAAAAAEALAAKDIDGRKAAEQLLRDVVGWGGRSLHSPFLWWLILQSPADERTRLVDDDRWFYGVAPWQLEDAWDLDELAARRDLDPLLGRALSRRAELLREAAGVPTGPLLYIGVPTSWRGTPREGLATEFARKVAAREPLPNRDFCEARSTCLLQRRDWVRDYATPSDVYAVPLTAKQFAELSSGDRRWVTDAWPQGLHPALDIDPRGRFIDVSVHEASNCCGPRSRRMFYY